MRQPFHMTSGLRVVSTLITALLRLGLPAGPAVLLSVRGRTNRVLAGLMPRRLATKMYGRLSARVLAKRRTSATALS